MKLKIVILGIASILLFEFFSKNINNNTTNIKNNDTIDVFYIISTEVISSKDTNENISYQAVLNDNEKLAMKLEADYVKNHIFYDNFKFYAPYYHQFTFDAIKLPQNQFDSIYQNVSSEICQIFDDYMKNQNNGHRFILAGFSQGAMLTIDLLKHMTDEQFSRMVANYMLGYRLSEKDLQNSHIKDAKGEFDTQVCVSFNTVLSDKGIWDLVSKDAICCINPVNWKTDTTSATFIYENQEVKISIDTINYVLKAQTNPEIFHKWMNETPIFSSVGVDKDCLHHWDLLFYMDYIHDNAIKRSFNK
ncbi:MAG: DUF3089 domain-containing protein [Bacteroidales bacterium]|nr:DUF3089 domain-containing protein [Bacteroidales bacterium]